MKPYNQFETRLRIDITWVWQIMTKKEIQKIIQIDVRSQIDIPLTILGISGQLFLDSLETKIYAYFLKKWE